MSIALKLKKSIETALQGLDVAGVSFSLEHPTDLSHGDYATNVAMVAAKIAGKNPKEFAELVKSEIEKQGVVEIDAITIAGPGFINFKLAPSFFHETLGEILSDSENFGKSKIHAGQKILVEHSSPNLFKPFHVGHMMNNAIGESLVRLMKYSGADVETMSFPSDISLGVAKAIFVLLEKKPEVSIQALGDAYVEGTKRYDEDESMHDRVKEIADNLYAQKSSPEWDMFVMCKKFNIEYFEMIVGRLGSTFDSYIYESEAGVVGKDLVEKNTPTIFSKSEGAIVYIPDESKKNLNTAVFINSQGNPTYEAKDIGLLDLKFGRIHPDISLFVTDHQQVHHFEIVLDAAAKINIDWANRSKHITHGRMSFKGQKMSSRLGGVPLATEILETVLEEVQARSGGRNIDDATMDTIAIAAIKFAILRAKPGQNINFDPETSLSFEGDSGPYLQYTHARIASLIGKGADLGITPKLSTTETVSDLERMTAKFPDVVENAILEYAPQYIVTYLLELSRAFNSYYGEFKIVDVEQVEMSAHRIALAQATQKVIKNGLWLLGIGAPDKM